MIKKLRGNTRTITWTLLTNGVAKDLSGNDLTLEMVYPSGVHKEMAYTVAGNTLTFVWQGIEQKEAGVHSLLLFDNHNQSGQAIAKRMNFMELIEEGAETSNGTIEDTTPSATIAVIDNLTSESTTDALSANQGRVLKGLVDAKQDALSYYSEDTDTENATISADTVDIKSTDAGIYAGDSAKLYYGSNDSIEVRTDEVSINTSGRVSITSGDSLIQLENDKIYTESYDGVEIHNEGGSVIISAVESELSLSSSYGKVCISCNDSTSHTNLYVYPTSVKIGDKEVATTDQIPTDYATETEVSQLSLEVDAKADRATTLSGYKITDAYTKTETDSALGKKENALTYYHESTDEGKIDAGGYIFCVNTNGVGMEGDSVAASFAEGHITLTADSATLNDKTIATTDAIPTKTSELTNDSGYKTSNGFEVVTLPTTATQTISLAYTTATKVIVPSGVTSLTITPNELNVEVTFFIPATCSTTLTGGYVDGSVDGSKPYSVSIISGYCVIGNFEEV